MKPSTVLANASFNIPHASSNPKFITHDPPRTQNERLCKGKQSDAISLAIAGAQLALLIHLSISTQVARGVDATSCEERRAIVESRI